MPLKCWQGWDTDHLSREAIPVLDHPLVKKYFLMSSLDIFQRWLSSYSTHCITSGPSARSTKVYKTFQQPSDGNEHFNPVFPKAT